MILFLLAKIVGQQASLRALSAAHGVMGKLCFPRHSGQWGKVVSRTRNLVDQVHYYKKESESSSNTIPFCVATNNFRSIRQMRCFV